MSTERGTVQVTPTVLLVALLAIGSAPLVGQVFRSSNGRVLPDGIAGEEHQKEFIIPDMAKWADVKVGMTEAELIALLGQPIRKVGPRGEYEPGHHYPWVFGYTHKRSIVFPFDLDIAVHMCMGRVASIDDAFGGVPVSTDGRPSTPKLLKPASRSEFDHFPRFVDMRWYPSSGKYPITYEIDVQTQYPGGRWVGDSAVYEPIEVDGKKVVPKPFVRRSSIPYYAYRHAGMNPGRWRVRAENALGVSDWSEYSTFEFLR